MLHDLFPERIQWEGLADLEATAAWINPPEQDGEGLKAVYIVSRESSLASAIGTLAALDQFTPNTLKGQYYYAFLAIVFFASARPFDPLYVPKRFDNLVDSIIEAPQQLRRTVKESHLVGTLSDREEIKQAIRFLCEKGVLTPLGDGEYTIARRPIRRLTAL